MRMSDGLKPRHFSREDPKAHISRKLVASRVLFLFLPAIAIRLEAIALRPHDAHEFAGTCPLLPHLAHADACLYA